MRNAATIGATLAFLVTGVLGAAGCSNPKDDIDVLESGEVAQSEHVVETFDVVRLSKETNVYDTADGEVIMQLPAGDYALDFEEGGWVLVSEINREKDDITSLGWINAGDEGVTLVDGSRINLPQSGAQSGQ